MYANVTFAPSHGIKTGVFVVSSDLQRLVDYNILDREARFRPEVGKLGTKLDKYETF